MAIWWVPVGQRDRGEVLVAGEREPADRERVVAGVVGPLPGRALGDSHRCSFVCDRSVQSVWQISAQR